MLLKLNVENTRNQYHLNEKEIMNLIKLCRDTLNDIYKKSSFDNEEYEDYNCLSDEERNRIYDTIDILDHLELIKENE